MKEIVFSPDISNTDAVVSYTDEFELNRKMKISVPNQYTAILFADGKGVLRIAPCTDKPIWTECGKDLLDKKLRIAFVHGKSIPDILYGFGNVQVNNKRFEEAYRAGANGVCKIEIQNLTGYGRLIKAFPYGMTVTVDGIKGKLDAVIRSEGTRILSGCLTNSPVSVLEISGLVGEVEEKMRNAVIGSQIIEEMGLQITELKVCGIHVNREDMESIRTKSAKRVQVEETAAQAESSLPAEEDTAGVMQNSTPDTDGSCGGKSLIMRAAEIQSNVEKNLITTFRLPHEGTHFVIGYNEYLSLNKRDALCLPTKKEKLHILSSDGKGNPVKIEMSPLIRFMKAGLPAGEAKKAAKVWRVLNCIRHRSPENMEYLQNFFDTPGITEKKFMSDALDFYCKNGLYTKN